MISKRTVQRHCANGIRETFRWNYFQGENCILLSGNKSRIFNPFILLVSVLTSFVFCVLLALDEILDNVDDIGTFFDNTKSF